MRKLNLVLENTKMHADSWTFNVCGKDLGAQLCALLGTGEFIGNISISITETAEVEESKTAEDDSNDLTF
jgi:hypothetical protein